MKDFIRGGWLVASLLHTCMVIESLNKLHLIKCIIMYIPGPESPG